MKPAWWKEVIVYQIYSYSFKDMTGISIDDLNGITSKLLYLWDLSVNVIWLSPIYTSSMKDMRYDISDYHAIHSNMSTMKDWEALVKQVHDLELKVVMNLMINHTSEQHVWFKESRKEGDKKN